MDTAQDRHSGFDGGHDVGDVVAGEDFSFRRGGDNSSRSDGGWAAVGNGVYGVRALSHFVGAVNGDGNSFLYVEVDGTEVRAHNVSVDLLAHVFEGGGVHQGVLAAHRSW